MIALKNLPLSGCCFNNDMEIDNQYMQRCIDLALSGLGHVAPNPMVGAVLVAGDKIIGEGYHRKYGKNHAEVNAIESVRDKSMLRKATLYVNLEPCCHHGKTPPCTDLILQHQIPEVVIGTVDPFDAVAGKGIAKLRSKGCHVRLGLLKEECRELNKRFFTFHEKKRPYVILKWAQTADGFIDMIRQPNAAKRPNWITSEKLRMLVHKWRTEETSIMVGTQTALKDNPRLDVRDWNGPSPTRIVIDKKLKLTSSYYLLDNSHPTLVINELENMTNGLTRFIKTEKNTNIVRFVLDLLYEEGIQSLFVEGGRHLLQSFVDEGTWDEARMFLGQQFFGDGVPAPIIRKVKNRQQINIGNELLYRVRNT